MSVKEIGMCAQNILTTSRLNSQGDWGDLHDHLLSTSMFTLTINITFIWASESMA